MTFALPFALPLKSLRTPFALRVRTLQNPYSANSAIARYSHSHYRGSQLSSLSGNLKLLFSRLR